MKFHGRKRKLNRSLRLLCSSTTYGADPPRQVIELLQTDSRERTARVLHAKGMELHRHGRNFAAASALRAAVTVALRSKVVERKQISSCSVNDPLKLAQKLRPDGENRLKREWFERLTKALRGDARERPEECVRDFVNLAKRLFSGDAFE